MKFEYCVGPIYNQAYCTLDDIERMTDGILEEIAKQIPRFLDEWCWVIRKDSAGDIDLQIHFYSNQAGLQFAQKKLKENIAPARK